MFTVVCNSYRLLFLDVCIIGVYELFIESGSMSGLGHLPDKNECLSVVCSHLHQSSVSLQKPVVMPVLYGYLTEQWEVWKKT